MIVKFIIFVVIIIQVLAKKDDATTELNKLKIKVESEVNTFEENSKKWQQNLFQDVLKFDNKTLEDVNKKIKRIKENVAKLKPKNPKCVDDQKEAISKLDGLGKSFYPCSSQVAGSTERNIGEFQNRVARAKGQLDMLEDRIKGCAENEDCLTAVIRDIKKSNIAKEIEDITGKTEDFVNVKKNELNHCSTVDKVKDRGDEIVNKIRECIDKHY
ncbi:unnamed protein product [Brassicogethes aeneus]|uniref:Uncharacterized protein n=1 Tax=Brassicogethes aeneus TaxID=1431903 RepID=A0A9P0FGR2_BRAAE|nr:unnamed protein product [Brassicogethes aeneus]